MDFKGETALLDQPTKGHHYFKVNQSHAEEIVFQYEAPVVHVSREQKGSKGIMYMLISAVFYTIMATLLKILYLNSNISTYEVTYFQSIVMVILNFSLFKAYDKDHLLVRDDMRTTLILRSVYAFLGVSGFYLALEYTDLSKATTLYWTNPMMTAVISYFVLGESLNFVDWLAIFVSFFGILVI
jgi:drug/metabolite transporter (DMT)-like permease